MPLPRRLVLTAALAFPALARARDTIPPEARPVPARLLPVPGTVSPELQRLIAAPYPVGWNVTPTDAAGWRQVQVASSAAIEPHMAALAASLRVRVEPSSIAGVPVFIVTPETLPAANRDRLLLHLHGGGYVLYPGLVGVGEAMLMASHGGFSCVSVDYRMPPDHPFPAALNDAIAVWRALTAERDPRRMAIFGSSAGGGLTLATLLRARQDDLPFPAAIAPGTPWCDLTDAGDSLRANAYVDNVLVAPTGWLGGAARLYAAERDLADPLISPIFGDFTGFPPAILTSGTRDLLLSDTVRAHRKLRRAGVTAALQVFEGQSHAQFISPGVPETAEAFGEIAGFLGRHLA
ncbi:alpha/beta hydrolase [Roseomonas sp. HJA6]|uniref:Alpha/beta hydrolase n=1 Tax=Roseomonas alba TaxID=2846776 RepID=A0ABS7A394_9PROT|nr:alpha/beta hydrolase [Neoroseomonas alba]MBW6396638.1 alpha/beta hydrolase [Neoroseomonas alba]